MATDAELRLKIAVDERLRRFLDALGDNLRPACADLYARRHLLGDDPGPYFNPLAQPIFQLPGWVLELGGPVSAEVVHDLTEASIAGYLHVRIHDDWIDEGVGDPGAGMLLAQALMARHHALLARHVGGHAELWALSERVWREYAGAMALERQVLVSGAVYDESIFAAVLQRSQPLVLPGAAALVVAGRWDALDALGALVAASARAAQLFNDLRDVLVDLARGQYTWVARRLGAEYGPAAVRERLVRGGGIEEILHEVAVENERARAIAWGLGLGSVVAWCDARRDAYARYQRDVFIRLLEALGL